MISFKNTDITIYNKYYDSANDLYKYQRTVLNGVNWQSDIISNVTDKGLNMANSTHIFMDKLDNYIEPKGFNLLSDIERPEYFTLSSGDIVVKGIIEDELTGVKPYRIADIQSVYSDVITILGISEWGNHLEVKGK